MKKKTVFALKKNTGAGDRGVNASNDSGMFAKLIHQVAIGREGKDVQIVPAELIDLEVKKQLSSKKTQVRDQSFFTSSPKAMDHLC